MSLGSRLALAAACAAGLAGALWLGRAPSPSVVTKAPPDVSNWPAARTATPVEPASSAAVTASQAVRSAPVPSKAAQIRALLARGTPKDNYQAFLLVDRCRSARDMEIDYKQHPQTCAVIPPVPSVACEDIDPGQMSSRLLHLRVAALAGVPGSIHSFLYNGPDGDGPPMTEGDPNTTAFQELAEQALKNGAANGDVHSLQTLSNRFAMDPAKRDPVLSRAYWIAANDMFAEENGKPFPSLQKVLAQRELALSASEIKASDEAAARIIQSIRKKRQK